MFEVVSFLIFAWLLSWIDLDEGVLDMLHSIFGYTFPPIAYYIFFGLIGLFIWLLYKLNDIRHRD